MNKKKILETQIAIDTTDTLNELIGEIKLNKLSADTYGLSYFAVRLLVDYLNSIHEDDYNRVVELLNEGLDSSRYYRPKYEDED